MNSQPSLARRRWLARFFWSGASLIGAGLGLPLLGYFFGPLFEKRPRRWVRLGRLEDFPAELPQRVSVVFWRREGWVTEQARRIAWVVRRGGPDLALFVFDPRCTHLGCAYHWDGDAKKFLCPCHGGVFNIDGCVVSGPPPRPLDTYQYKVEGGVLYIESVPERRASCEPAKR